VTAPTPLDPVTADDLLLDRMAARRATDQDDALATMLLAVARQCDTPLRQRPSGRRRLSRRRTLTALAALGLTASGAGMAAAVEKTPPSSAARTVQSPAAQPTSERQAPLPPGVRCRRASSCTNPRVRAPRRSCSPSRPRMPWTGQPLPGQRLRSFRPSRSGWPRPQPPRLPFLLFLVIQTAQGLRRRRRRPGGRRPGGRRPKSWPRRPWR